MYRVVLKPFAAMAIASCIISPTHAVEVYLFKGAGDFSFVNDNLHFSRGLNKIADTLNAEGIHAEVRRFGAVEDALATIRRRKPESVAFIGHSMGALASLAIARNLKGEGIRIAYMGLIDIPGPVGVAGDNVEKVENYFSINPVYGKLTNVNTHRDAKNVHVFGYIHNRMDDSPKVQEGMLTAIREIQATENQLEQEAKPEVVYAGLPKPAYQPNLIQAQTDGGTSHGTGTIGLGTAQEDIPEYVQPDPKVYNAETIQPYTLPTAEVGAATQPVTDSRDPLLTDANQTTKIEQSSKVDPVTTASVRRPRLVDKGRAILHRAGNFVRRLNRNRNSRADAFAPQPDR
ncbi:MAG: thioesterase domain-containing protein [Rhizobiaceae bacterium]